ncbi:c-type cytochrome [Rhodanobacter denitrificans]|uniref:Cytochrome c, mono-and diheme variants family n=1 Tax=Rhodanobacter denitrificans TaxID=666685 RepID=M4NM75_9GAMM|nr:cytochrome c [Rhodanobacter denitrificans]AGG88826.1 cytochrome c, mono- and diheme variants family [Rhodanobacter denitrificans]ODV27273.1 MAG: cytochrome C oxidase Cbb3 [Rhodanobacter sp. SCN 68-63]UJM87952.1 cytochrome c [Rhodanobacter denitrificans]
MNEPIRQGENADPNESNNPVPRVVLALVVGLVIWAGSYIVMQSANAPAELGDGRDPVALAAVQAGPANGAEIYTRCQGCHQANGQGLPGVFPPLAGSPWVIDDAVLATQIVLHGLTGPIKVLGTTYDGAMPAFGEQLSDAEIAAVLTHIRADWGNGAGAVDEAAVAAARKQSAARTTPWHGVDELKGFLAAKDVATP